MRTLCFVAGLLLCLLLVSVQVRAEEAADDEVETPIVDENIGKSKEGSKTDDETVKREEEAIQLDGLSVAEMKELREKSEKHHFQAEVSRMMKLIINSLYKNKEIFLRELISNASDALDKIRILSLTDETALHATKDLTIKIKADKENKVLHITDTGIGMTKDDLVKQLGTIAKSGTSEFFAKMQEGGQSASDLIGQFGVGFYSTFLVADRVVVTSKSNDDKQHIWESDAASFSIYEDPRGEEHKLPRGTTISLYLKEEAHDFLETHTLDDLVKKYSQFINFNIYLWKSKTETVEEPIEEEEKKDEAPEEKKEDEEDDAKVEDDKEEEKKPKTKSVEKTTWDWELMNGAKPLWQQKPKEVKDEEYAEFYKAITKDTEDPMAKAHFNAEGEVTFKSILFVPKTAPHDIFSDYGKRKENIKMYVRRVFITDDFESMMPKYLSFIRGVVDSDDLPLNVSREQLQQHKLLKVIRKKLVRKALDMIKKLMNDDEAYEKFYKEYSTNMKLGVMEDHSNRTRLTKLLRFRSSNDPEKMTSLADYITRMKDKQESIFYVAGANLKNVKDSPFVERLLKKGYEVLYMTEPVDEYCVQNIPEFEGKKFQNVAKDGVKLGNEDDAQEKAKAEALSKEFEPLTKWVKEESSIKDDIEKCTLSKQLTESPAVLVASSYGNSGNMERIIASQAYAKAKDPSDMFSQQKKTLELNPRHPLVKKLLVTLTENKDEANELAKTLFFTASLRSGYEIRDGKGFASIMEKLMRKNMNIPLDEVVEEEEGEPVTEETPEEVKADEAEEASASGESTPDVPTKEEGEDVAEDETTTKEEL